MSFLRRFGVKSRKLNFSNEQNPDSLLEEDEQDPFSINISGTLALDLPDDGDEEEGSTAKDGRGISKQDNMPSPVFDVKTESRHQVIFEITSAEIVKEQRSEYVLYTVMVSNGSGIVSQSSTVDKRYSDFEKLHIQLKRKYQQTVDEFSFPRKLLMGNFSRETIAHRSRAFEQYLTHVYSLCELRNSVEFALFFYLNEARDGFSLLCSGQYRDAISTLEKCLSVAQRLEGCSSPRVTSILQGLTVCYHATDKFHTALKYADVSLKSMTSINDDEASIALIKLAIHLCWSLGKDKLELETKLQSLRDKNVNVDQVPDLKDIVRMKMIE